MRSRLWHLLQAAAGLLIVVFMVRYVVRNWDQVQQANLAWRLSPLLLLSAVVLIWIVFAVQAEVWRRLVRAWGWTLQWFDAATIWLLSSMAKYIPGKVWSLAGMAVMSERRGIPAWAATSSALLLQILSVGTGALLVAVSGLAVLQRQPGFSTGILLALVAGSLAITLLALWPPLTRRAIAAVAPKADLAHIPRLLVVVEGAVVNLAAWIGYGVSFWLVARGSLPETLLGVGEAVGTFTASYLAGLIAPFAPGGLGVRESVLVLALQPRVGLANALALAAVSRLVTTAAEVIASVPFLIRMRENPRG